jgi:hypothetical protein
VQASSVEHPPDTPSLASATERFGPHVELLDTPIKRKQAPDEQQPRKRRREMDMDMDLPMDLPEGSYGPGWYEPEKDRIVVTSLSSPESSPPPQGARISRAHSRDASPDPASDKPYSFTENRHLSQPGSQGFTISPSLLTHILNAQREQLPFDVNAHTAPERGLVLYRPVPGMGRPVVEEWNDANHVPLDDSGRFEEVDDDEELTTGQQQDANMDMDEETPWQYAEEAMDIE